MSLSQEERDAVVSYRIEKAENTLNEAKKIATLGLWNTVANRLYYPLYHAITALLIKNGYTVHTHAGAISLIGLHFVKTNILSMEDNRLLKRMYNLRQEGDYEDFIEVSEEDIEEYLPSVEALITKINSLVNNG